MGGARPAPRCDFPPGNTLVLGPKVLASRMVRDYITQLYTPAAALSTRIQRGGTAKSLAGWQNRVRQAWPQVRIARVESLHQGPVSVGADVLFAAWVELDGLSIDDVEVQLVAGDVTSTSVRATPSVSQQRFARIRLVQWVTRCGSCRATICSAARPRWGWPCCRKAEPLRAGCQTHRSGPTESFGWAAFCVSGYATGCGSAGGLGWSVSRASVSSSSVDASVTGSGGR